MRVLVMSNLYPYPLNSVFGVFVHDQVKELARRCEVLVVSPTPLSPPVLRRLKSRWAAYAAKPRHGEWEGVSVYYPRYLNLPGRHGFPLSAFLYRWTVERFIAQLDGSFDFDLIHAHTICPDGFAATRVGHQRGKPVICTAHGSDVHTYPYWTRLTRRVTSKAIREVDTIIAVSAALREQILSLEQPKQRIRVIGHGVEPTKFAPIDRREARAQLGLAQDEAIVLYASRLEEAKGLAYLLLSFKSVAAERSNCRLVIAGDGSCRHRLEQRVLELGLQHRVLFAGLRPHHEMVRWMCACDVVVHPSLAEGSPLPVYEALACGRPVVASSVGGIPELIVGEQYGLLVPPADSASLAEALRCSLDREWDPEVIRDRGLQFSWSAVADRLMSVYQEAVDG